MSLSRCRKGATPQFSSLTRTVILARKQFINASFLPHKMLPGGGQRSIIEP